MGDDELKTIVGLAQKRDPGALSELYEAYFERIYRYILVRVRNVAEAEDLAGQVFLKMVERIDSFKWPKEGGGFSAWLFRIAHNQIVDWSRGHENAAPLVDEETTGGPSLEETVAQNETLKEILLAMNCLKDDHRQVLLLRLVGGLSSRETAACLGTTEGNVRVVQYRALVKVRERLRVIVNA